MTASTTTTTTTTTGTLHGPVPDTDTWNLLLYVAGQSTRSLNAYANLTTICEAHLRGRYQIEVIDLLLHPQLARINQILAIPTLVRSQPKPERKIIGDLSNIERVLKGLDLYGQTVQENSERSR